MEYRNFRTVLRDMWQAKIRVGIFLIVMVILCAGYGFYKARKQAGEIASIESSEEYSQYMEEYQASLEEIKEATSDAVKTRDEEKEYVDNSIYMQLDSTKIYTANAQYTVSSNVAAGYNGTIVNVYNSYIKEGGFVKELAAEYAAAGGTDVEEEYLKELVVVTPANPIFSVSIMCTDQDMADRMLQAADKVINGYKSTVEKAAASGFKLDAISKEVIVKSDPAVLNAQNSHLNSLKTYENAVKDQRHMRANTLNAIADYKEDHMPEEVIYESPKKALVKWAVFGIILGLVLPFAFFSLKYVLGGRLKDPDDLVASGMSVILRYVKGKGYTPEVNRTLIGLEYSAANKGTEEVGIWALSDTEEAKKAADELGKALTDADCILRVGDVIYGNDADVRKMREMIEKKYLIILVETGVTTYRDIEEMKQLFDSAGADVWGFLAVC